MLPQPSLALKRNVQTGFSVLFARTRAEIAEAQSLRYRVFVEEMGARVADMAEGIDRDTYDAYCEHLLVRDNKNAKVVGTYRILAPSKAQQIGGFYADEEFELTRLNNLRGELVELGRSCVHPDYRSGAILAMLWRGIARYMQNHGYRYLMGCASVSLADGGTLATRVSELVRSLHAGPSEWRVFPRLPLPLETRALSNKINAELTRREIPPLIKGYLHAGALVCGDPAWDPGFNTADFFMLLPLERLAHRHAVRFLDRQASNFALAS
ncbi:MAG TPA: GNAT family N-acyltransferase [Burkholderiales bacterium]|nr:GNAT family N-acyltransferase [Burkholderiales bacterium]